MSIQYMDNFSFYGTTKAEMLKGLPWADVYSASSQLALVNDPDGVSSGKVVNLANDTSSQVTPACLRLSLPVAGQQIGVGFRWFTEELPSTESRGSAFRLKNAANSRLYSLHILPTGQLRLNSYVGASSGDANGTVVDTTASPVVTGGTWYHTEFYMDTNTGAYEVRIEGTPVLTGTEVSHTSSNIALIEWLQEFDVAASSSPESYIKDLVVWDDNGTVNNTFIGPVSVIGLLVDGDVSSGWTPSTGTSDFELLDKTTPNDATYIEAGDPPPAASIMTLEDLPEDIVGVRALMSVVRARKTDGGDANIQISLISNGSEDAGSDDAASISFRYHYTVSELSPDTATSWTPVEVNNATIKIDRTL